MKFKYASYIDEMKKLIDDALEKINRENPEFEIYTVSIWTRKMLGRVGAGIEGSRRIYVKKDGSCENSYRS